MSRILSASITALCLAVPLAGRAQIASSTSQSRTSPAVVTEYATPNAQSFPQGLDIDRKGNIWYAETAAGKIAVLRSDLTAAEYPVPNGGQPITPKVASDGIWFTDGVNSAIGNLNPSTGNIVEYAIPSGGFPLFLQIAADGSKWFTVLNGVGRLAPNGIMTEWDVDLEHPDDNIEELSIDPSGNVWFTERNFDGKGPSGTNKVRRLNPKTNVISTYRVPTLGGNPAGIHTNANGTVWVSEYFANAFALLFPKIAPHADEVVTPNQHAGVSSAGPAEATRYGPQKGVPTSIAPAIQHSKPSFTLGWIEYPIPTPDTESEDMRVDRFGRLWYEGDTGFLGVFNPYTAVFTQYTIPSPDSGFYNLALDLQTSRLWFSEAGAFAPVPTKIGNLYVGNF